MGKRGAGTGFLVREKLGRDIMALCIMSKCGDGLKKRGVRVVVKWVWEGAG